MPDFDFKGWLAEAGKAQGANPETLKQLEDIFTKDEAVRKYAGESFLRQSDYSRKQNELREQIRLKEDEITTYEGKLHDWENQTKAELDKAERARDAALKNLDKLKGQFQTVTSKLKSGYDEYGLPLPEVRLEPDLDPMEAPAVKTPGVNQVPDNPNYVPKDEYTRFANTAITTPFELQDIAAEHYALYGKPLGGTRDLLNKVAASKGKLSLRDVWEQEHNVSGRRQELNDEAFNVKVNQEVEKRYQEKMSQAFSPSPAREAQHASMVLKKKLSLPDGSENKSPVSADGEKDPMRGVMAAVQAHMRGDYRPTP